MLDYFYYNCLYTCTIYMLQAYWGLDWRRNENLLRNETNMYSTELFTAETVNIINNHNTSEVTCLT